MAQLSRMKRKLARLKRSNTKAHRKADQMTQVAFNYYRQLQTAKQPLTPIESIPPSDEDVSAARTLFASGRPEDI